MLYASSGAISAIARDAGALAGRPLLSAQVLVRDVVGIGSCCRLFCRCCRFMRANAG